MSLRRVLHRWKPSTSTSIHWDSLLADTCNVCLHRLMCHKVLFKLAFLQVRLEAKYLFRYFLVLSLYAFKLCLALIEVKTLGLELDSSYRVTLAQRCAIIDFVKIWFLAC